MNVQMSFKLSCVWDFILKGFILWKTEFLEYWDLWSNLYQIQVDYLLIPPLSYKDPKIMSNRVMRVSVHAM